MYTDGKFKLHSLIKGGQLLLLHSQGHKDLLLKVRFNLGREVNLGILLLEDNFSDETPSFGPKYYYGYGRTYFVNLTIGL